VSIPDDVRSLAAFASHLLAQREPDHALPQKLYTDARALEFDLQAIFHRYWIQAGFEVQIPKAGDWITLDIGPSSIVLVRAQDGLVQGLFNTCRHRGAKICTEGSGHASRLVCPYHQWSYDLSGRLVAAPLMPEGFDRNGHSLRKVPVESLAGILYVCLSNDPPDFAAYRAAMAPLLAPHRLQEAKIVHTSTLIEAANWKLVMENARECYHCRARHPELMQVLPDFFNSTLTGESASQLKEFWAHCQSIGLKSGPVNGEWFDAMRYPLAGKAKSITSDGAPAVVKPLGDFGNGEAGALRWAMQPNCFSHVFGDYAFFFRAMPSAPRETIVTATWLVHQDNVKGVDYDLQHLTEIWAETNKQDRWLAENNHLGVASLGYTPGPYSPTEPLLRQFVNWYCSAAAGYIQKITRATNEAGSVPG
jgi:Rieske 2Fe-2S family protein